MQSAVLVPTSAAEVTATKIQRSNSKDFPKRFMMEPHSPVRSPRNRSAGDSATNRLYKAPSALIRRGSIHENPAKIKTKSKSGSTRRRRRRSKTRDTQPNDASGFTLDRQLSDNSLLVLEPLSAAQDWQDGSDSRLSASLYPAEMESSLTDIYFKQTSPRQRRPPASHLHVSHGYDESDYLEDDSHAGTYHSYSVVDDGPHLVIGNKRINPGFLIQLVIIFVLGVVVYDSNHKVSMHKVQLQQYDEERSHILEQMMWIDKAAKKVHTKYSGNSLLIDLEAETKEDLTKDVQELQSEMEQLQLRIQLNARDRIHEKFGDNPMQVSLSLDAEGGRHVVIGLSDDTPHAAGTWLQQIDKKFWDDVLFEAKTDFVQVSTRIPNTSPLLEFVEKSRRCREVGSVAVRQLENMELHVLVLRINLTQDTPMDDSDVCIGQVIGGMDELHSLQQDSLRHHSHQQLNESSIDSEP